MSNLRAGVPGQFFGPLPVLTGLLLAAGIACTSDAGAPRSGLPRRAGLQLPWPRVAPEQAQGGPGLRAVATAPVEGRMAATTQQVTVTSLPGD